MRSTTHSFILLCISLLLVVSFSAFDRGHGRGHDQQRGRGHGHGHDKQPGHKIVNKCSQLETISQNITWRRVKSNPTLPAKLIRMQFHDCFVRGCDASILLDSTANNKSEKEAVPNRSLSGFDVIDEIKAEVEDKSPGQVSCADIIALATRDAVSFQFKNE